MSQDKPSKKVADQYDRGYDYTQYWNNRDYENAAEQFARDRAQGRDEQERARVRSAHVRSLTGRGVAGDSTRIVRVAR